MARSNNKIKIHLTLNAEESMKDLGYLLQKIRRHKRISVVEMAKRIGVDRRALAALEAGTATVSIGVLFQVLDLLGLLSDMDNIMNGLFRQINPSPSGGIPDEKVNF